MMIDNVRKNVYHLKKNNIYLAGAVILFLVVLFPYLYVATYASPSADDFPNLSAVLEKSNKSFLGKTISQSINVYQSWQGTYSGSFLCSLGLGIFYKFGILGLHLEYVGNICLFFVALWCVIKNFFKKLEFSPKGTFALAFITTSLMAFIMLYDFDVSEVFYWLTGLAVYTLPLSFSLFTVAILMNEKISARELVIASILGFIAAGGSLNISAFICGVTLLLGFYKFMKNKRIDRSVIVFLIIFVGTIINVAAPGNYVRHEMISNSFPIWISLKYSCMDVLKALWGYIENGTIMLLILLSTLLYNKLKEAKVIFINPILLAVVLFMGSVIIDFPVYLGYAGASLPLRCVFIRRVTLTIFLFAMILNIIGWLAKRNEKYIQFSPENCIAIVMFSIIALKFFVPSGNLEAIKPFKIYYDIYYESIDHRLSSYEEVTNLTLSILENSVGQDVVINVPNYDSLGYLKTLGLTSDPTYWVNVGVAKYYGNNSIVFTIGQ